MKLYPRSVDWRWDHRGCLTRLTNGFTADRKKHTEIKTLLNRRLEYKRKLTEI